MTDLRDRIEATVAVAEAEGSKVISVEAIRAALDGDWTDCGMAPAEEDHGCCALDDKAGIGHEGPCASICGHCQGAGGCPACRGSGDDGSGLDYTCTECGAECGGGSCPYCDEGMVTHEP